MRELPQYFSDYVQAVMDVSDEMTSECILELELDVVHGRKELDEAMVVLSRIHNKIEFDKRNIVA